MLFAGFSRSWGVWAASILVTTSAGSRNGHVDIAISETGAGISPEDQRSIFDLAYDADWVQGKADSDSRLAFTARKPTGQYDLVLMLDVLEHVEDDRAA